MVTLIWSTGYGGRHPKYFPPTHTISTRLHYDYNHFVYVFLEKLKLDSLTTIQKDDLLTKLMEDFDMIKQQFAGLVDSTLQSLRHNNVNLEELKVAVKEYLPNEVHNLFSNAKSLNDLFLEDLSEYWSFFDYELLAFIIKRRCKELQGDLDEYIAMFKEYCKRKYSEVPTVFNSKAHKRYYNLTVKVCGEFDHITMEQVKEIECQLQKITGLDLSLARIGDGCIELVFISLSGEDDMLPLSVQDKEKLSEMGILKLYSDKCVYYDNGESSPSGAQLTHPKKLLPDPNTSQPAEEVVKKLEEQLNCSICHNSYTDPKLLQCNHVFCRDCLVGLAHRNPQGLPCPTCRQVTPIPPSGVAGLQPANEILDQHKKVKQDILYCQQHQNQELELYCETCEELICFQCTIQQHHGHKYNLIGEVFEKHKKEIMSSLNPAEQQQTLASQALERLDVGCREITDQQAALQAQIHKSSQQLHEVIDLREKELANKLNYITQEKLSKLASQREKIETTLAQLGSCLDMVKEKLRTGSQGVVLRMKTALVKQVKDLTTAFKPDIMELYTDTDMRFLSSHVVAEACRAHGLVATYDPSQWYTISKVTDVATVGKTFTATFTQHGEEAFENLMESLECELVSELTGTRARGSVERRGQSQYEVSYQPTIKGRHQLHIKVMGEHIIGSPHRVAVNKLPDEKLGTPIQTIDLLNKPLGIALNQSGEVVVTSPGGNCVSVFSQSGDKLQSFGTEGSGQGQFMHPYGVAVDGEGNILVADRDNHRIQKFTAEGQFLAAVGTKGSRPLQFDEVEDIAINTSNNKMYVVDTSNYRIQVLNSDLTFSNTFGKRGENKGEFIYPWAIACDSTGNVYVVDFGNDRIQVFTPTGKFLRMFGSHGEGDGELDRPVGIALDVQDKVYVSERSNDRISVFTSEGQFVTSFGSKGGRPGEFDDPRGLAVDSNGVLYVCDLSNKRLQLF